MTPAPILAPGPLILKYLFGALLTSGDEIFQTPEDRSAGTPGKSAYYDLLIHDDQGHPIQDEAGRLIVRPDIGLFQLAGEGCVYLVDLRDGHFEVGPTNSKGRPARTASFYMSIPPAGAELRLVYFRRRRHHTQVTIVMNAELQPEITDSSDAGQECEYHFGWRTADGKHQATVILV